MLVLDIGNGILGDNDGRFVGVRYDNRAGTSGFEQLLRIDEVGTHGYCSCCLINDTADGSYLTDRKSTRLNSSHQIISYAVFCLKKKKPKQQLKTIDTSTEKTRPISGGKPPA